MEQKKSTGTQSLESSIPKDADLSIKQNEGFSFFCMALYFKNILKRRKMMERTKKEKNMKQKLFIIFLENFNL